MSKMKKAAWVLAMGVVFFSAPGIVNIAGAQTVPPEINYQGRLLDSAAQPVTGSVAMEFGLWDKAVTEDPVIDEAVTMTGTSPIPLANQNLVSGSLVVTAVGGSPVYESPRDYLIDLANGTITRVDGGFILDGTPVEIDYTWTNSGTLLWSEPRPVEVDDGIYQVVLGEVNPLPAAIFDGSRLYLEVKVGVETLSPRAPVSSVPYAMRSWTCSEANYLDGLDSTDFSLEFHTHDASDISSGVVDVGFFSAYDDLMEEAYLDNDDDADLLTRTQADGRFVNTQGDDAMAGSLTVGGDLEVTGGNIGVGVAPHGDYSITNDGAAPPVTGAFFTGSNQGLKAAWSGDPLNHFAILGHPGYGVYSYNGSSEVTSLRYGAYFQSLTQGVSVGVSTVSNGFGGSDAIGGQFMAMSPGTGKHYGVQATALAGTTTGTMAFGVHGSARGFGDSRIYGGHFSALGLGTRYGVYGEGLYGAMFTYSGDTANNKVVIAGPSNGISIVSGKPSDLGARTGLDIDAQGAGSLSGARFNVESFTRTNTYIYGNYIRVKMHENPFIGHGLYSVIYGDTASAAQSGVTGLAYGYTAGNTYGLYGYASNTPGNAYGLYASAGSASDYAGYFATGKVRVGTTGTPVHTTGSGDLYVADDVEAGGDYFYNSPQTRYFAVTHAGEHDGTSGMSFRPANGYNTCPDGTTCGTYYPVNFPDRATVTALRVWGYTGASSHAFTCSLSFTPFTSTASSIMASVMATSTGMTLADTSVVSSAIDNSAYSYNLYCYETASSRGASVLIYGIRIDYTVEGPE